MDVELPEPIDSDAVRKVVDGLRQRRPSWVTGSLSWNGSTFLATCLLGSGADTAVEVGTASGYSTAVLAAVLDLAARHSVIDRYRVDTFDVSPSFYADRAHATGAAARELVPELLDRISFHTGKTAADVPDVFERDSLSFVFIDANHKHPWPTLDLLLVLPCLKTGAVVVLDDVNLPIARPEFPAWGAHHLLQGVAVPVTCSTTEGHGYANMGSFRVPSDREGFRQRLLGVLDEHRWEAAEVPEPILDQARTP